MAKQIEKAIEGHAELYNLAHSDSILIASFFSTVPAPVMLKGKQKRRSATCSPFYRLIFPLSASYRHIRPT